MRVGIGLPAAVPGTSAAELGAWATASERAGFCSVGVIDRLVYDNVDPLIALAAAAASTERVELLTTVLNVVYRGNAVLLAKQLASVNELASGRLTAGLGLGGWPEDYAASQVAITRRGALFDAMLETMRHAWCGALTGASGPIGPTAAERPRLLFGGLAAESFTRAAAWGEGWVAPSFGLNSLTDGIASARRAWAEAGREDRPRVVAERYFCFGEGADGTADHYLEHYYGRTYFPYIRADTVTTRTHLRSELERLDLVGCTDVVLLPCAGHVDQVARLADALASTPYAEAA